MKAKIDSELYDKLYQLGLIPNEVRSGNVGKSNYSKHIIQPWSIWIDYNLNPWDADIVKRVLRTKEESGMSPIEARIMDYEKIKHVCDERIRQLKTENQITTNEKIDVLNLTELEKENYKSFALAHVKCSVLPKIQINNGSGIGTIISVKCPICGEEQDITDYTNW